MKSSFATLQSLVIPAGAGPNDPRIELNGTLPAQLVAFYNSFSTTLLGGIVFYQDADNYAYIVEATQGPAAFVAPLLLEGVASSTGVRELSRMGASSVDGSGLHFLGGPIGPPSLTSLHVLSDAEFLADVVMDGDITHLAESMINTTSWSPTWTQSTTNPTLNNGTLTGRYRRQGDLVWFDIRLIIGSTTSLGTGDFQFTLPVTPPAAVSSVNALAVDSSAGTAFPCAGRIRDTPSPHLFRTFIPAGGRVTEAAPFAWATNDSLEISGIYRV